VTIPGARLLANGAYAISIELDTGLLGAKVLRVLADLSEEGVKIHPTTAQKILLLDIAPERVTLYLRRLEEAGALIRRKGTSFQPRSCIGKPYCSKALQETFSLSKAIYHEFKGHPLVHKFKVAVAGCPACCSWANTIDLGFVAQSTGYQVLVGGKGGYRPQAGTPLGKARDIPEALVYMKAVLDFFNQYGEPKKRLGAILQKTGVAPLERILDRFLSKGASQDF